VHNINRITPRILIATDFSSDSERAFFHALSLAVAQRARLTLLHIGPESRKEVPWDKYPGVRDTLVDWQMLDAASPRSDVIDKLGLNIKKMAMRDEDPYNGMVDYLRKHPTDLLVMATEARRGMARLKRSSVAEAVAFSSHSHALLIPSSAPSLVDSDSGAKTLQKVLVIYDHEPDPRNALAWLNEWLPAFGEGQIEVHLLYLGDEANAPEIVLPSHKSLKWTRLALQGPLQSTILEHAEQFGADMIVMMNQRSRGLLGRFRGSLNEQILRRAGRPVLLLPEI